MSSIRPLHGLRVVDLADEKAELCGRLLADFGADVVRVEPPAGAQSRSLPPFHAGHSLHFGYRNAGKRGVALDLDHEAGRDGLFALLGSADVFVDTSAPGRLEGLGLGPDELGARFPGLVVVRISDFGSLGPLRDWVATDAVLEAVSGMLWKAGLPDREPLLPPTPMAYDIAGVHACFAVLTALVQRGRTGFGQQIDLSVLEAAAQCTDWSFPSASVSVAQGITPVEVRAGSGPLYTVYACKGGFVRLVVLSPRQWRAMWEWLGEPEAFADPFFESFIARLQNADLLIPVYTEHFASMTMEEVSAEAQRRGIVCTPVLRPDEVLANEHLLSRGSFAELELAPDRAAPAPSGFHEIDGRRQGPRGRAPEVDEHRDEVFDEVGPGPETPRGEPPAPSAPLAGLRVLDFGIGGVGVEAGRMFADYGADVIKVETRSYPDFIRVVLGSEMSPSFASSSRSKRGFGLNLKKPGGLELAKKLVERADVIIENSKTGAMAEMGLGWADVKRANPRCVMVSSQLLGSRGAWADWIGYGPSTQPVGGMVHLWNYADAEAPAGSTSIFPDHLVGRLVAINALVNLLARERSGVGAHGEVAQVEAVTGLLGELLWKAAFAPGSVAPVGNANERGAPWGVYPCAGEQQWCVISVRDDADWQALVGALGTPDWAADTALATADGRRAARAHLDAKLAEWSAARDKHELCALLQRAGVPAGPMLTGAEQIEHPQFTALGFPQWIEQPGIGRICFEGPAFRASGMSAVVTRPAPGLGEHTAEIAAELLGLSGSEIDALLEQGVLEGPPPTAEEADAEASQSGDSR